MFKVLIYQFKKIFTFSHTHTHTHTHIYIERERAREREREGASWCNGYRRKKFLSGVKLVWIQSFLSSRLVAKQKAKNPASFDIFPSLEGEWTDSCLSPKVLLRRETQTASSRIWTRIADIISNDDSRYAICPELRKTLKNNCNNI